MKGLPHRTMLMAMKHRAGLLFHKWGVAVGHKLEDILLQEKVLHDRRSTKSHHKQDGIDFMYQGMCDHANKCIKIIASESKNVIQIVKDVSEFNLVEYP